MEPPPVAAGGICPLEHHCLCSWRKHCSPEIPAVFPGKDYSCLPAGGDDRAARSLLVGFISSSPPGARGVLGLHRFRVAQSGRILGRSDDVLEPLEAVDYKAEGEASLPQIVGVTTMPSPDGRSLCLFTRPTTPVAVDPDDTKRIRPLQMHMDLNAQRRQQITVATLPEVLLYSLMRVRPVSAAGHVWAACFSEHFGPPRLLMKRLDEEACQWENVATVNLSIRREARIGGWGGRFLHGYAVVGRTILLSLYQSNSNLFVAFNCSTLSWAEVVTTETRGNRYLPIRERGVYVEEDDTIYLFYGSSLYAYKLCQDKGQYRMAPPTKVDCICPYDEEGYGFVTHLGCRIMCSVWIGVSLRCGCDAKHVLITTFRVEGDTNGCHGYFIPNGVEIIHSTCRRLDISPNKPSESHCDFRFLLDYAEINLENSMLLEGMEVRTNSNVVKSSNMLVCCRKFLTERALPARLVLRSSAIQFNKALYIICQTASVSSVCKVGIVDGRLLCSGKVLTAFATMDTFVSGDGDAMMDQPHPWHFVCSNSHIYAVPCIGNELYLYNLHSGALTHDSIRQPVEDSVSPVLRVDGKTIAISGNLQCVYLLTYGEWKRICTTMSFRMENNVKFSGYVALSDNVIMVSDADSNDCYLLDMQAKRWSQLPSHWSERGVLSGRSIFVDGFVYTCADKGIAAFEVIEQGGSYFLGRLIYFNFLWRKYWEKNRMCLDYAGKDTFTGANVFCVVQGGDYNSRPGKHPLCITIVQVETTSTQMVQWKQVVGHVDFGTAFVKQERVIWSSNCFVVDP